MFCLHLCLCSMFIPAARQGQKRESDALKLEFWRLWATMWMLGAKPWSSGRMERFFWDISSAPTRRLLLLLLLTIIIILVCMGVLSACICVYHFPGCLVPSEAGYLSVGTKWSYKQSWAAMWALGIEPESFGRTASDLNHHAISPAPFPFLEPTS